MQASLLYLVSLVVAVSCHPLLFHLEKNHPLSPDIICPDQKSQCMQGSTCCRLKLPVEGYGCCPQPQASCCEDGIHCCPHMYTCSNSNTCSRGDETIPATKRLLATTATKVAASADASNARRLINDITCPDYRTQCPSTETCCLTSNDRYGCCPVADAVCCADGIHCCPSGFTCDLSKGTCESLYGGSSILMISKRPPTTATASAVHIVNAPPPIIKKQHQTVTANEPQNVMCNDKKTQCADGDTCCMLSPRKEYGCCPMTNATCCSDGVHCCPSKYTCNVSGQICSKGSTTVPLVEKVRLGVRMATSMAPQTNVVCPNKETECSAGSTCCKLKSGQYACCPIANALCCSDGEHCCPQTYTCNTKDATCTKGNHIIAMFTKQPGIKKAKQLSTLPLEALKNIICPDKESQCASNATCCLLKSGVYGCCPIPFAVCCKDGLHCCPNDYACQEGTGKCTDRDSSMAAFKKRPALRREEKSGALITPAKMARNKPSLSSIVDKSQVVTCSDGASICPDGFTCCRNASGGFGCCPHVSAVCCDDDKHCCPKDYTCDQSGSCLSLNGDSILPLSKKVPASTLGSQKKLLAAVADQNNIVIPLLRLKKKQVSATAQNKYCPDGGECLSTQTCCKLDFSEYGCCPYSNGECCSDDKHCCPSGHYCYYDECLSFYSSLPVMKKQPLLTTFSTSTTAASQAKVGTSLLSSNVIICPNQKDECSDSSTCCPVSSEGYGCCPVKDAICCNDGSHCCPQGYSCNTEAGTCSMGSSIVSMLKRSDNLRQKTIVSEKVSGVVCPDHQSECPSGCTCCQHLSDSRYDCCPLENAQCCTDGKHCCPNGFKCDLATGQCTKGDEVVRIFTKQPAIVKNNQPTIKTLKNNVCPDEKSECPNQSTCCKLASGNFACCPMENAVCCRNGKHCCPSSYNCATDGTCTKGKDTAIRALLTELSPPPQPLSPPPPPPSSISEPQNYFPCPEQTTFYCRTGQTCCRNSHGAWECCNSALAVCCSQFNSCCPQGNKCPKDANSNCIPDVTSRYPFLKPKSSAFRATKHFGGSVKTEGLVPPTVKQPTTIASFKTEPAFVPKVPQNVVCPDRRSECSSNTTCCLLKSGGYGCCPLPKALCCRDEVHCCPEGYECKTGEGNCIKGDKVIAMFKKQPAIIKKTQNIVCPDERSECDNKSTCCLLGSGTYGCCPVIDAQCCDDKVHCCPSGYRCKTDGSGACVKGDHIVPLLKKQPAITTIKKSQNIVCPDGQNECDINSTCCLLASGTYGCCPVPRAQCCEDRTHCCPEDYKCEATTCTQGDQVVPMLKKQPAILKRTTSLQRSSVVFCKDKTTCPDKSTCCKLKSGQYGCCPQLNGVCCSDGVHCCPAGFTCDLNKGTCTKGDRIAVPFLAKLAVATPKRVIKSDKIVSPSLAKLPVATVELPEGVIKCPDNGYCPDTSTCCLLESGRYGCCPQVKATCCSDKEHCCPQNYKCQFKSNTCTKGSTVVPMLKKLPSFSSPQDAIVQKEETVVCPDQRSECPTDSTCCLMAGTYRCCPGKNSVCCGDRIHCCPEGYTCHVPTKTCTKGDTVVPMLKKSPPSSLRSFDEAQDVSKKLAPPPSSVHADSPQNVICPNHDSQCPDRNTCCQGDGKNYNCCPTPDAVCCPDKKHCCPKEYTCNEPKKSCDNVERGVAIPFMEVAGRAATKDDVIDMTRDIL